MCRVLYTAKNKKIATKKRASSSGRRHYDKQWKTLIEKAENWKHGDKMDAEKEILDFIRFTIRKDTGFS